MTLSSELRLPPIRELGGSPSWSTGACRLALTLLAMAFSAGACGAEKPSAKTATGRSAMLSTTECYSWSRRGLHRNQGPDTQGVDIALHASGQYEAAIHSLMLESLYESGRWTSERGRVLFHPAADSAYVPAYRSLYAVAWEPGESLGWVVDETAVKDPRDGQSPTWETVQVQFVRASATDCHSVQDALRRAVGASGSSGETK